MLRAQSMSEIMLKRKNRIPLAKALADVDCEVKIVDKKIEKSIRLAAKKLVLEVYNDSYVEPKKYLYDEYDLCLIDFSY
ncbi:hypothetical protein [Chitiniphilus eburneus]|uniref:Uncharacterized protein n=1 Tax=Chitiniphilus eburneus TaxID=2571148 RepID=A0A4U0PEX6_9NEIS|nr:hypothetical protein [Chitiniphilus eburneus]TJZ66391.1 hypothetical protein FAZ21_17355 [Chitiniphilus eburneus]